MGKAIFHAESSAKKFGGKREDYLDIHEYLDSSRAAFPDLRHRALTHTSFFIDKVIERVFGVTRVNSNGKQYSVKAVAEHHVLEDFGMMFIPSAQDFLGEMEMKNWMDNAKNGAVPPSRKKVKLSGKKAKPLSERQMKKLPIVHYVAKKIPRADDDWFRNRPCANAGPGVMD